MIRVFCIQFLVLMALQGNSSAMEIQYQWKFNTKTYRLSHNFANRTNCFKQIQQWHIENGTKSAHGHRYLNYLRNYPCGEIIHPIAEKLRNIAFDQNFSRLEMANFLIAFVTSFPYILDKDHQGVDHYAQTPYETLVLGKGDCEDHAILLAKLYNLFCYKNVLIRTANENSAHLAVGIAKQNGIDGDKRSRSFNYKGKQYLYCEATPCKNQACASVVGECSESMAQLKITKIFELPLDCQLYFE